ncbi:MAG: tetratricopeptide repeat protein [Xenococcaceae cyanobacterium MO_167.B52]|nr:tetratricopeptide repeat protein [Xenococcaceae cyanobacterium MO_167.B52]
MNNQLFSTNNLSISQIKQFQDYLEKATSSFETGDLEVAISYYQKANKLNPQNTTIYRSWGETLFNLNRWEEAVKIYQQGLVIDPNSDILYYKLAEALVKLEQWENAIITYQQALNINPNLPGIHRKLGDAFYQRASRDKQKLLVHYLEIIRQSPNTIQNYHQALELEPRNVELYVELGNALVCHQKLDEAIVAYQTALQIQSDYAPAQIQLDRILQKDTPTEDKNINEPELELQQAKKALDSINNLKLKNFFFSQTELEFPKVENPLVSIVLILYNRAELTLSCLDSILHNSFKDLEVVIIDNNSSDRTNELLDRIHGAKIVRNPENRHFLLASNQAGEIATGKYLLFLNNDAQILGNSIKAAVETIESDENIGAVGGKIILPDGTLQEAGSIIWKDGSCLGYGRGDDPESSLYRFQREVDYCSGAFLLTPRDLFIELGKFDEAYQPAYYEETDYCVRLHKAGKKIIYDPKVAILHYEFASSQKQNSAIELQKRNQQIFITRHKDWLKSQQNPDVGNILIASRRKRGYQSILFVDDRIPHPYLGSGYTRSHKILNIINELGFIVTFYATDISHSESWLETYSDISNKIEIVKDRGLQKLEDFLKSRPNYYDIIFISRPHNMSYLNSTLERHDFLDNVQIIYDAEALYCLRDFAYQELQNNPVSEEIKQQKIQEELALASNSNIVISVSPLEQQKFIQHGYPKVEVLGHSLSCVPTEQEFSDRKDILFVGAIYDLQSPNADSIIWLIEEIFPIINQQLGNEVNLVIVGNNSVPEIQDKIPQNYKNSIQIKGRVDNLLDFYNSSRLFVAPTRYAAGIPHKVHEAAAYGLPIVTTSLIAKQLQWQDGEDLLVGNNSEHFAFQCIKLYQDELLWQRLRDSALAKVDSECSPEVFTEKIKSILLE